MILEKNLEVNMATSSDHPGGTIDPIARAIEELARDCILGWGHLVAWKDLNEFFFKNPDIIGLMPGFSAISLKAQVESLVMSLSRLLEDPSKRAGANLGYFLNLVLHEDLKSTFTLGKSRFPILKNKDHLIEIIHRDQATVDSWRLKLNQILEWRNKRIAHLDKGLLRLERAPEFSTDTLECAQCVKELFTIIARYAAIFSNSDKIGVTPGNADFRKFADLILGSAEYRKRWLKAEEEKDIAWGKGQRGLPLASINSIAGANMAALTYSWEPLVDPWDWDGLPLHAPIYCI
jgi:hypothetical protein